MNWKRGFRNLSLTLVAAFLLSGIAAASALAAPEFKTAEFPVEFSFTGSPGTLETKAGRVVTCESSSGTGEVANASQVKNVVVDFTGCKARVQGSEVTPCQSGVPLLEETSIGEIKTKRISGSLVYTDEATKEVGIDLVPEAGGLFAEFTCGLVAGIGEGLEVQGSVIGRVPNTNSAGETQVNTPRTAIELVFSQSGGVQQPRAYEEGGVKVPDFLETTGSGAETFGFEESGIEGRGTVSSTEAVEVAA